MNVLKPWVFTPTNRTPGRTPGRTAALCTGLLVGLLASRGGFADDRPNAKPETGPTLPALTVYTATGEARLLATLLPDRAVALLLIDPRASASQGYLQEQQASGYRGFASVVLVLDGGPGTPARPGLDRSALLPEALWLHADAASTLASLQLAGTPALLGIDAARRIRWRQAVPRGDHEQMTLRLLDWVLAPRPAPTAATASPTGHKARRARAAPVPSVPPPPPTPPTPTALPAHPPVAKPGWVP